MKKVLVTDGVHPILIEQLELAGYHCDYHPKIKLEKVHEMIAPYEGIIINSKIIFDKKLFDTALNLKFIGRLGSGLEIIDLPYAKEKGVRVHSAPEGNRNAVAEHVLGMLLSIFNKLNQADQEVRAKHWDREKNRGRELMGCTVGIIGFGHTGRRFAEKLAGMEVQVLAYDKYKTTYADDLKYVKETDLNEVVTSSDVISFHLPLNPETKYLADAAFFQRCKDGVILLNTSRGNVIKTIDLYDALQNGKVGGAALDVFENEKPQTYSKEELPLYDKLFTLPNTIFSPHVAGWTVESKKRLAEVLLKKILQ